MVTDMQNQRKHIQKEFQFEIVDLKTGEILYDKIVKDEERGNCFRKLRDVYERYVALVLNDRNVRLEVISSDIIVPVEADLFNSIWSNVCLTPPF